MLYSRNGNPWWVWHGDDAIPSEVQINMKAKSVLIGQGMGGFANKQIVSTDEFLNSVSLHELVLSRHDEETLKEVIRHCQDCANDKPDSPKS